MPKELKTIFNIVWSIFLFVVAIPFVYLGKYVMGKLVLRKYMVILMTVGIGLFLLLMATIVIFHDFYGWFLALGTYFILGGFSMIKIEENEDFKAAVKDHQLQRKEAKKAAKNGTSSETADGVTAEEETGLYTAIEVVVIVEDTMSNSNIFPKEDIKKPDHKLSKFYEINNYKAKEGILDITFFAYPGKTTVDLRKIVNQLVSALQYETAEEYNNENIGLREGVINVKLYETKPKDNSVDYIKEYFDYSKEINSRANYRSIPFGIDTNRKELTYDPYQNHLLIGGSSGGGKSVMARTLIAGLSKTDAILFGVDMKQGVELNLVADRFSGIAIEKEQSALLLEALVKKMNYRYSINKKMGRSNTPDDDQDDKPIVLVIDEAAQILDKENYVDKEDKELFIRINSSMKKLFSLSRAANIAIIMMTQSPKAEIINTSMRNNFMTSIALRTKDSTQMRTILGDEAAGDIEPIKASEVGAGYIFGVGFPDPVKFKTYFANEKLSKEIVKSNIYKKTSLFHSKGSWKELDLFYDKVWEDFLAFEVSSEMLSEKAAELLLTAETLTPVVYKISKDDFDVIQGYIAGNNSDTKTILERFPDLEDLNSFVQEGYKLFK